MSVGLVINFNGNCREALDFYTKVFKLDVPQFMDYSQVPQDPARPISDEEKSYVVFAHLNIAGMNITMQDLLKPMQSDFNSNITISIGTPNISEITDWFNAMKDGGTVTCHLQEMPWSKYYGAVKDKFGTSWQFMYEESR